MQYFSIKDIENLSGIKAHTLRIWEKRYQLVISKRKDSNHRYFDNEDLKTILRITYLYQNDFKISQIAGLSREAILTFANIDRSHCKNSESYILQLINPVFDFDEQSFETIFNAAIQQFGFEKSILDVAYGLLKRIGLLWLTDHLIPAQEHFLSALIRKKILLQIEGLPKLRDIGIHNILLFTPAGEYHEIPLLFIQYLFKKNQISTTYLGANISEDEIADYLSKRNITHLYFHTITNLTGKTLDELIISYKTNFPEQTLVVSGNKASEITVSKPKLIILKTQDEMVSFPQKLFKSREAHNY